MASRPTSSLNSNHLPSPAELAFSEGWQAFRSGDYPGAIAGMRRALRAAPTSALAEDARYWEAVALARQGSVAQSRAVMEDFLRHFPGSPRAGEVSAMLGWFLVESHDWAAAERRFRAAESDRAPAVRESAKKGLEITGQFYGHYQRQCGDSPRRPPAAENAEVRGEAAELEKAERSGVPSESLRFANRPDVGSTVRMRARPTSAP